MESHDVTLQDGRHLLIVMFFPENCERAGAENVAPSFVFASTCTRMMQWCGFAWPGEMSNSVSATLANSGFMAD